MQKINNIEFYVPIPKKICKFANRFIQKQFMTTPHFTTLSALALAAAALLSCSGEGKIDRQALVSRNNPHITEVNPLHSLNLGNGAFTLTLDATGLQTFPEYYKDGLSLGTYSEWGWHSFPDKEGYTIEETLEDHPLPGHPHGIYSVQEGLTLGQRGKAAAEWVRSNPHRMHLGNIGFAGMAPEQITDVDQTLDMWDGVLHSSFRWNGTPVKVTTVSGGDGQDLYAARISSEKALPIVIRFPYPTGQHSDDASDWGADDKHSTEIVSRDANSAVLKRTVDASTYYVSICWDGKAGLEATGRNCLTLSPEDGDWSFCASFSESLPAGRAPSYGEAAKGARKLWNSYWKTSGVIDFSHCTDPRAPLLERRVVLFQYLMRVQEAQNFPPAETGMTYNSWFGKFHLEMVMWHSFHYATWNKPELLAKQLDWYLGVMPKAREIAERQGFPGVRWMKMTDPWGAETPSDVGSFIIWQQPHPIYMAELIYRATKDRKVLEKYADMVQQTAEFMASFVSYDAPADRYIIEGACAANENYNERSTVNPAFEMSYWHFGLKVAQEWRERLGEGRIAEWDEIMAKLAPLSTSPDGIYLPAEKGPGIPDFVNMTVEVDNTPAAPAGGYFNGIRPKADPSAPKTVRKDGRDPFYVRATSSENLLAYGMLPECRLFNEENMQKTVTRAAENWGWKGGSWSWNYPTLMMNATRLHRTDIAVRAATMDGRSDLLLPSGNNYRSERLRMYLPGNGGLLLAVGMMCAGWDGCDEPNPGFPKDGTWDVRWEGLTPMP